MPFLGTGHIWVLLAFVAIVVVVFFLLVRRILTSVQERTSLTLGNRRECPACKEWMRRDARLCPHCRTESEPWMFRDGRWWVARPEGAYYLDERSGAWRR